MKRILLALFCLVFGTAVSAQAHSVWINNFVSEAHMPPHSLVSIGWGHAMPMDDIPNSPNGRIALESFQVIDPDLRRTDLRTPAVEESKPSQATADFDVYPGDLAVQKIALKKESKPGVYQFSVVSAPSFYQKYLDKAGRPRLAMKPRDQVKDIGTLQMSVKFQAFAKSYMTVGGQWTQPKPLGHGLEIIPTCDVTNLRTGDLVTVRVLFNGEPLSATAKSIDYISAHSPGFGQSDHFALQSFIMDGKAQFRAQCAGQWMVSVNHKDDVTKDGPMKDLFGKADQVYHAASLTFIVK
ncbi:MAG: DUF4198 domain-containing protein [Pseudodesulfovibrio sp.]